MMFRTRKLVFQVQNNLKTVCNRCFSKLRMSGASSHPKGYMLLVIPATTFCLGTWQVYRRQWKLGLIEDLERRTLSDPVPLPEDLSDLIELEYCPVIVRGSFDHSKELYVFPRSLVATDISKQRMVGMQSSSGYHVITPFRLADRPLTILVNRGWVSRDQCKPESRQNGQIEGEIELTGLVRLTEKRQPFGFKNEPVQARWYMRNVEDMANAVGTDPVFIDADKKSTVEGGPLGGQTHVTLRNEHLSYIITWYSLCVATLFLWYTRVYRAPPPDAMTKYLKKQKIKP